MAYTTDTLISAIGRKSFLPTGQTTFTDAELLLIADEATLNIINPAILAVREEFLVFHSDYSITANKNAYNIPPRAIGMIVRDVAIVDGDNIDRTLPRIEPEEVDSAATGTPKYFYMNNNQVVLYPTPATTSNTLRIYYFLRPSELVDVDEGAIISAINTTTNIVSVSAIPSTWTTGDVFDFIKKDGGQEPIDIDYTSTLISSTDITFSSLPSTLRVGDYMALAGKSTLVQLPAEFRPILALACAVEILEAQNQPGADKAAKKLEEALMAMQKLISPRTQGSDRVILNTTWF